MTRRNAAEADHDTYIQWRRELAALERAARVAELVTTFMDEHPLWSQFLKPLLEGKVQAWERVDSWNAPTVSFDGRPSLDELRGMAKQARHTLKAFDDRYGKRDTIRESVEKLRDKIQAVRKLGRVPPEWDDEAI